MSRLYTIKEEIDTMLYLLDIHFDRLDANIGDGEFTNKDIERMEKLKLKFESGIRLINAGIDYSGLRST